MPKQKDGFNWRVDYTVTIDGVTKSNNRKFRVTADARGFVTAARAKFTSDPRVTTFKFTTSKIEKE
jgi:hypothetical protein